MSGRARVKVTSRDTGELLGYLGPETPFGDRPLVDRADAEVLDGATAGRVMYAYLRGQSWRRREAETEDVPPDEQV